MNTEEAGVTPTRVEGEFVGGGAFQSEPLAELVGPGSLTVLDEGVRVVTTWRRTTRGVLLGFAAFVVACVAGGVLGGYTRGEAGVAGFVAVFAVGVWLARRASTPVPYDRVIPWYEVQRPGLTEGLVIFEVTEPRRGAVRFRVPGWDAAQTRVLAQELVRHTRA